MTVLNSKKLLLILGLAGFTVMADNWVISPILPAIAKTIDVPVTDTALLISAYMLPFGLFQLIFGPLADRYGKRTIINLAMFFFTFATALCSIGVGLTDLAIYRALTGIFAASVMPVSLALIGDVFPLEERQSAIGTMMGMSFLGQGLSMAIGGSIAYFLDWRGVFVIYAVLAITSTILLYTAGKQIPNVKNPNSKLLKPYKVLLSTGESFRVYLTVLLEGILILGSFSYLGAYIDEVFKLNYLYIGLIMTAFGVAAIIGGRLCGKLAAKIGRKPVLLLGLSSATVADLLVGFLGQNLTLVVLGVGLLGLGFTLAHSTLLTFATEFADKARGAAMSLVAFCFMGGGGVGTVLGGKVIKAIGYEQFFLGYGSGLLLLIGIAAVLVNIQAKPVLNEVKYEKA